MTETFHAVIETTVGVFRATTPDRQTIAITEDGVEGILDFIHLHPNEVSASSRENLPITLKWWVLENVRGIDVLSCYLDTRE